MLCIAISAERILGSERADAKIFSVLGAFCTGLSGFFFFGVVCGVVVVEDVGVDFGREAAEGEDDFLSDVSCDCLFGSSWN